MNKSIVKRLSLFSLFVGCGLLVLSAVLFGSTLIREKQAEADLTQLAEQIEALLPEYRNGVPEDITDTVMPVLEIDGQDFLGLLEIPDYHVKLPVYANWDADQCYFRPARFTGSAYDGTLVIDGNYTDKQFGFADQIDVGADVIFTDMRGQRFYNTVIRIQHADDVKTENLQSEEDALILFVKKNDGYLIMHCATRAHSTLQQ